MGLPELRLRGLTDEDARALLGAVDSRAGRCGCPGSDHRGDTGKSSGAAGTTEGYDAAELAGGFPVPRSRDLSGQLEEHFLRRLEVLPEATQRLLLVAAADPTGDVALLWRAARKLGIERELATAIDAEELVEIGSHVWFRHPLVRSAIYSGASAEDRRAVHLALAAAMDPLADPDRRAWHRALAAPGPDEEVASELERSAGRAQSRGGLAAAAAFLSALWR